MAYFAQLTDPQLAANVILGRQDTNRNDRAFETVELMLRNPLPQAAP